MILKMLPLAPTLVKIVVFGFQRAHNWIQDTYNAAQESSKHFFGCFITFITSFRLDSIIVCFSLYRV